MIYNIRIEDNGMGMRKEVLENILTDNNNVPNMGQESELLMFIPELN